MAGGSSAAVAAAFLLLVALVVASPPPPPAAFIYDVQPSEGSMQGNTRLTITGHGFARDGQSGTTRVYVDNRLCKVNEYDSSDNQLVCYTPFFSANQTTPDTTTTVQVAVSSVDRAALAICQNNCNFRYEQSNTPVVDTVTRAVAPGHNFSISSSVYTNARRFTIYVGGKICPVIGDQEQKSSRPTCETPDIEAGTYSVSINIDGAYGDARLDWNLLRAKGNHTFHVTVFPEVHSVSTNVSGAVGGHTVVITGNGFSETCTQNEVYLSDVPCAISSCGNTEIRCTAGLSSAVLAHTKGSSRGVQIKIWRGTSNQFRIGNDLPDIIETHARGFEGTTTDLNRNAHVMQIDTLFWPPFTGNFTFYVRTYDSVDLMLSSDASESNLAKIVSTSYSTGSFYERRDQISSPVHLEQGKFYRLRTMQGGYYGHDDIFVGLRGKPDQPQQLTAAEEEHATLPERQQIKFFSDVRREKHKIELFGVPRGNFYLSAYSRNSEMIDVADPNLGNQMHYAYRTIYSGFCYSNSRSINRNGDNLVILVELSCPHKDQYELPRVMNVNLPHGYSASVSRTQNSSEPISGTFRVGMAGDWTPPLEYDIEATDLKKQLEALSTIGHVAVQDSGNAADGKRFEVDFRLPSTDLPDFEVDITGRNMGRFTE